MHINVCIYLFQPSEGTLSYVIGSKCANILLSIQNLIEMYCQAFRVDFLLKTPTISDEGKLKDISV